MCFAILLYSLLRVNENIQLTSDYTWKLTELGVIMHCCFDHACFSHTNNNTEIWVLIDISGLLTDFWQWNWAKQIKLAKGDLKRNWLLVSFPYFSCINCPDYYFFLCILRKIHSYHETLSFCCDKFQALNILALYR